MASRVIAAVWAVLPSAATSQRTVVITAQPSCLRCVVALQEVVVLGDSSGDGRLEEQGAVMADGAGHYFVASNYAPGKIRAFGSTGKYLRTIRPMNRQGSFQERPLMAMVDGGIALADMLGEQLQVLDAEFRPIHVQQMPPLAASGLIAVGDAAWVVAAESRTPDLAGIPLHLISRDGHIVRSFGSLQEILSPSAPFESRRVIAAASRGDVWSARVNQYTVELWDLDGVHKLSLHRDAEWFPAWVRYDGLPRLVRPKPSVAALQQNGDTLVVLVRVPDAEWKPRTGRLAPNLQGATVTTDADWERIYDTMVEVIDLRSRRLIASSRVSQNLLGFVSRGHVVSFAEGAAGSARYTVWSLRITP